MFRRLYRQRRRILFLMVMVALAVAIHAYDNPQVRYMLKHEFAGPPWITMVSIALAFLIVMLGAATLAVLLFPSTRRALEIGGVTLVILEMLSRVAEPHLPGWAAGGYADWIAYFCVFLGISFVLERDLFFRFGLRLPLRFRATRTIAAPPEAIWAAVAPDAQTLGTYWTKTLLKVVPWDDLGPDVVEVHYRLGRFGTLVQRQTRLIWDAPRHLRYRFERDDPEAGIAANDGTFEMRCEPLGDGRSRVTLRHDYPALGLGTASLLWFDDLAASELDAIAARITGRRDWSVAGWAARKMARA